MVGSWPAYAKATAGETVDSCPMTDEDTSSLSDLLF
jgi:hypothetical protein